MAESEWASNVGSSSPEQQQYSDAREQSYSPQLENRAAENQRKTMSREHARAEISTQCRPAAVLGDVSNRMPFADRAAQPAKPKQQPVMQPAAAENSSSNGTAKEKEQQPTEVQQSMPEGSGEHQELAGTDPELRDWYQR